MTTVYLALGSNVGDSSQYLKKAIELLDPYLSNIKQSPIYSTKPVGYIKQGNYLNMAIRGETKLSPKELLEVNQKIEQNLGRVNRFRWGPREIDIDIIFYGNLIIKSEALTIPHPRFQVRDFVLQPLADIDSEIVDPLTQKTVKQLLNQLTPKQLSIINKL